MSEHNTQATEAFQAHMDKMIREAVEKQLAIRENFIARYLSETSARIADTMLIEQRMRDGITTHFWCEPKPKRNAEADERTKKLDEIADTADKIADLQHHLANLLTQV